MLPCRLEQQKTFWGDTKVTEWAVVLVRIPGQLHRLLLRASPRLVVLQLRLLLLLWRLLLRLQLHRRRPPQLQKMRLVLPLQKMSLGQPLRILELSSCQRLKLPSTPGSRLSSLPRPLTAAQGCQVLQGLHAVQWHAGRCAQAPPGRGLHVR